LLRESTKVNDILKTQHIITTKYPRFFLFIHNYKSLHDSQKHHFFLKQMKKNTAFKAVLIKCPCSCMSEQNLAFKSGQDKKTK